MPFFLDTAAPDLMPNQGSDLGRALDVAGEAFGPADDGSGRSRAVVVVSDGEDQEGGAERAPIVAALVDAAFHAFAPAQRPTRGLRAVSALGAVALIAGWLVWLKVFRTIDLVSGAPYRVGTFLLAVGAVLSVFSIAIALTHRGSQRVR